MRLGEGEDRSPLAHELLQGGVVEVRGVSEDQVGEGELEELLAGLEVRLLAHPLFDSPPCSSSSLSSASVASDSFTASPSASPSASGSGSLRRRAMVRSRNLKSPLCLRGSSSRSAWPLGASGGGTSPRRRVHRPPPRFWSGCSWSWIGHPQHNRAAPSACPGAWRGPWWS